MKKVLIAIAALIAVGVIVFFSIRGGGDNGEKVYVEAVKARRIEAVVSAPGEVDPKFKVNISAHVIGKIDHLYFNEGDNVKKGQVLIELERPSFQAAHSSATAQLESRRIEVSRAKAQLATAQVAYNRAASLRNQGIQAQEAYDRAISKKEMVIAENPRDWTVRRMRTAISPRLAISTERNGQSTSCSLAACSIVLSRLNSATNCFKRVFSSCSCFICRT